MPHIPCDKPCVVCPPSQPGGIFPNPNDPNDPYLNLSAEAPDSDSFFGRFYQPPGGPPLGTAWLASSCLGFCSSSVSQAAADDCAQQASMVCLSGQWPVNFPYPELCDVRPDLCAPGAPPPPAFLRRARPLFANSAQSCTFACPDGPPFTFVVPAATFYGFTQAAADAIAYNAACNRTLANRICVGPLALNTACVGSEFSSEVSVSTPGNFFTVALFSGSLPPGVFLSQSFTGALLEGTPTVAATYTFVLEFTDGGTNVVHKTFTVYVEAIATASPLPPASFGQPYSTMFHASNTDGTLVWSVTAGTLPPGLTLNTATGALTGTPSVSGTYMFTISYVDDR